MLKLGFGNMLVEELSVPSVRVGSSKGRRKSIYMWTSKRAVEALLGVSTGWTGGAPVEPVELEPEELRFGHWCHQLDR
jgi:hypothetical protein